jgi:hypothetical protein
MILCSQPRISLAARPLDLNFCSRRIAVETCGAPCFERACSAIAVLEKLDISDFIPLETRQEAKWRCDFPPVRVRLLGKRAEESDSATLLNDVGDLEVECLPEALDFPKDIGQRLRAFVSAGPRHNFPQFRVVEVQRNVCGVRRHELPEHVEIRCVLQNRLKHSSQIGRHDRALFRFCQSC